MPASRRTPFRRILQLALVVLLLTGALSQAYRFTPAAPRQANSLKPIPAVVAGDATLSSFAAKEQTQRASPIAIEGWAVDAETGQPVVGARAQMGDFAAVSDAKGHFTFTQQQTGQYLGKNTAKATVELSVKAPGYSEWTITGAHYLKSDVLRFYPELARSGHGDVTVKAAQPASGPVGDMSSPKDGTTTQQNAPFALSKPASLAVPATIRVYRTQLNQVDVVPFRDYIKHVLPNEWIPTWHPEALKAGAMAVKMYAWYWINQGGKQKALSADVKDNVEDQVYDPNVSYASSDAAVDATFDYVMTLNGALFPTQYCAGSYSEVGSGDCPWSNLYMTQWGSAYHADHGKPWGWILQYYYTGAVITPSPPGGGYNGTPIARITATRIPQPPGAPSGGTYTIGQGSDRPDLFKDAYDRNGGAAVLGVPLGPVRWWLTYVTEFNVHAQHFSGSDGRGNVWIVYDTLKASSQGVHRAFVLTGDIAAAYAAHTPPGPEWVGAPTSDPYVSGPDSGSVTSQGFTNGALTVVPGGVQFTAWPQTFAGWKAEYFPGHDPVSDQTGPSLSLSGQPALVKDVASPSFDWSSASSSAAVGVGKADWSAQFTKDVTVSPGSYDFKLTTDGGLRLWLDGVLSIDSWQARHGTDALSYSADLDGSPHRVRIQYFNTAGGGKLQFDVVPHSQQTAAAPPAATPAPQPPAAKAPPAKQPTGQASLRIAVQWLGRGPSPSDRWALPLTLQLSVPGNPVIVGTYKGTTDRNGVAFFDNLPAGIFDVHVKGPHNLQSARAAVGLQSGSAVDLDMRTQVEGDVNGDNCVTPDDLSTVQASLGTHAGVPGYQASADLNGDGVVDMTDLSLLRSGFDRCGDISADNDFHIMSNDASPSLSEALSPWLNPASMAHTMSLQAVASPAGVHSGSVFNVAIMLQAGSQSVDGASFVLHYDPQRLKPVDASGNPVSNVEPGWLLPSVTGDWVDTKGGAIGYSAGIVQGDLPSGGFTLATIRFKASAATGPASITFEPLPSPYMEVTNGGENLLSSATGTTVQVQP